MANAEKTSDAEVASGLLLEPRRGVENDQSDVGVAGTRCHIRGVLHVSRAVGNHKLALGGGRVAVGHVNRDALLALGAKTVGHKAEVEVAHAALLARGLDGRELVIKELPGVHEKSANKRRLPVVHRSNGGEAQKVSCH